VVLTDSGVWFDECEAARLGRIAQPVMRPMCGVGRTPAPRCGQAGRIPPPRPGRLRLLKRSAGDPSGLTSAVTRPMTRNKIRGGPRTGDESAAPGQSRAFPTFPQKGTGSAEPHIVPKDPIFWTRAPR
jgi:hypothetical protein